MEDYLRCFGCKSNAEGTYRYVEELLSCCQCIYIFAGFDQQVQNFVSESLYIRNIGDYGMALPDRYNRYYNKNCV